MKMMKTNSELARMRGWYEIFNSTAVDKLSEVYRNPSQAKRAAYDECLRRFKSKCIPGKYRIIGHNCDYFTVAYTWGDENGEAMFTVETYANTYTCRVADID